MLFVLQIVSKYRPVDNYEPLTLKSLKTWKQPCKKQKTPAWILWQCLRTLNIHRRTTSIEH